MKDNFYVVLLSNSSYKYYPENKTNHFITKLPQHIDLQGEWVVALTEIQIPLTFQHIASNKNNRFIKIWHRKKEKYDSNEVHLDEEKDLNAEPVYVSPGLYENIELLIAELNSLCIEKHCWFTLTSGNYVTINTKDCISRHMIDMSASLKKILGLQFKSYPLEISKSSREIVADCPANLYGDMTSNLLVYTDLCEPYVTGDVCTKLLRNVSLDVENYVYGCVKCRQFSSPIYLPVLCTSFETIEIDIRNHQGVPVPFDDGLLSITLHFKKLN